MSLRSVDAAYLAELAAVDGSEEASLTKGGGGDTSPPVKTDDGLKGRVDTLQVFMVVFLAGLMALAVGVLASVNTTNTRLDGMQKSSADTYREVGIVGAKVDANKAQLDRIERQLEALNNKLK